MTVSLGRRNFIAALGGVAAWPLAARAQQANRVRRVGVLIGFEQSDPVSQHYESAFAKKLGELGWTEDRNVRIDYRWNARDVDQARVGAKDLIEQQPDVLIAHGPGSLIALRNETHTIPIVFTLVSEPVANGFVQSLTHPGGNITGFSNLEPTIGAKWVEIIKEIAPGVARIAIIFNPNFSPTAIPFSRAVQETAAAFGIKSTVITVHDAAEIKSSVEALAAEPGGAVVLPPDAFVFSHRALLIALATQLRLPTIYSFSVFASDGVLVTYGVDGVEEFQQAAGYADRILRGASAGELPVVQPTKFELVLNLKTAKALGLTIPEKLLATADEVIE